MFTQRENNSCVESNHNQHSPLSSARLQLPLLAKREFEEMEPFSSRSKQLAGSVWTISSQRKQLAAKADLSSLSQHRQNKAESNQPRSPPQLFPLIGTNTQPKPIPLLSQHHQNKAESNRPRTQQLSVKPNLSSKHHQNQAELNRTGQLTESLPDFFPIIIQLAATANLSSLSASSKQGGIANREPNRALAKARSLFPLSIVDTKAESNRPRTHHCSFFSKPLIF